MTERQKPKIIIYEPEVLFWGIAAGFHGYAIEFINQYADCIYLKKGLKRMLKYRLQLWKMGIKRFIPFVHKLGENNSENSVLVGFTIPAEDDDEIQKFKGSKYFHLMDYYLFVNRNLDFLTKHSIDYVIGHTEMGKNCKMFRKFYYEYINRNISIPFGYQKRFICVKPFENRQNIAIGLGSINPVDDPRLSCDDKKEFVEYYSNERFMHPLRRYIQTHKDIFANEIESRFPSPEKQKDFSYDAVDVLNSYTMFINDAGLSNFPPARTYEGIACGCVMVAENNNIYNDLGFIPDENYIAFEKGNYIDMKNKINYYRNNLEKMKIIQRNSLKLSKKFSHLEVAKSLYMQILETRSDIS